MLSLHDHKLKPRPITWNQQKSLLQKLPGHLVRMTLFGLNTGVRDDVTCSLKWEWKIPVPELGISVFEVTRQHVKGRKRSKILICNSVAPSVIESVLEHHDEHAFV